MKTSKYPLYELDSDVIPSFKIGDGVCIISNNIDLKKIDKSELSDIDRHHLIDAELCLEVNEDIIAPKIASILFIISCRLLKRSKVFIRYRVDSQNKIHEVKDNYPFITAHNTTEVIRKQEFKKIVSLYNGLNKFKDINKRTGNAVYFIGMAYRSRGWLESLIFHVCALETLTSAANREMYSTNNFIKRIHNFIGYDKKKLDKIYNIRSELVHGRFSHKSSTENLKLHRIAESACKKMFKKILLNDIYLEAFKKDDLRMKLFIK